MKHQNAAVRLVTFLLMSGLFNNDALSQNAPVTANNFSSYLPYTGKYGYGINPGYYGTGWSTQNVTTLAMGDTTLGVKGVGAKAVRVPLYDDFLTTWGLTNLLADYQYFSRLGGTEITAFVGHPHVSNQLDTTFPGATEKSKVFKGMYEPVWLDSAQTQINPANTYARYLYDVVRTYGQYVKFWEIVNEPDFTYSPAGWFGDNNPPITGSWFDHNPTADELVNFRATIFYYIRMLRVSWSVIKKVNPGSYVCTGGIGYRSFLDALLRNTDNPVDGAVTTSYPLKAGAYFDILSFHNYPMYNIKEWDPVSGSIKYSRHSDAAALAYLNAKNNMDSILKIYGYNGTTFPRKQFICTETGVSRIMSGEDWGSNEGQKNYMIKAHVLSQKSGIRQVYWFQLGDGANPSEQFDRMGLYNHFGFSLPYNAKPSDQGIALKTMSDLLYGKTYDSLRTVQLNLPATVEGGAFKSGANYVYVLWAKTNTDLSEMATAKYSFPGVIKKSNMTRMEWNFSGSDTSSVIPKTNVTLSGSPSFFVETNSPVNQSPVVNVGADITITEPMDSLILKGTAQDPDGSITSYRWEKMSGPSQFSIVSPNSAQTAVKNLVPGEYSFRLTATDNRGATGIDDIVISHPILLPARIEAETYVAMSGVLTENAWGDPDGGGLHVGWIDKGDWMQYAFYSSGGTYRLNLRVASANSNSQIQIKRSDNSLLTSIDVPNTGGWQSWKTISDTVTLSPGLQTIRFESPFVEGWNINWMEFIYDSTLNNRPPAANAGTSQTITLPIDSVTLSGSGSDPDGQVVSYLWTTVSGPLGSLFTSAGTASTSVKNLVAGTYVFRLTVTDNQGATGRSDVTVTVNPSNNQPPAVNAGIDQTIVLPVNSVNLSGTATDTDGSIVKYKWTQVSGPAGALIGSDSTAATSVSGLAQGIYLFRLTVTDNGNATGNDDVAITVNAPTPQFSTRIEAEAYHRMLGVSVEKTLDTSGVEDVTSINDNDWMDYDTVNVQYAGTYTVNFRVACTKAGTKFQLRKADGTVLATVNVPATGGSQSWQTVSATVVLSQGRQTFRILATRVPGTLAINWWELKLTSLSATATSTLTASSARTNANEVTEAFSSESSWQIYPVPFKNTILLNVSSPVKGLMKVQIYTISGMLQKEFSFSKSGQSFNATLPVTDLSAATYILKISLPGWQQSRQILKQ